MPEGRWPRGVIPRPRSGQWPRVPGCDGAGMAERSYPSLRSGAAAGRSYPKSEVGAVAGRRYPTPEARGGSREDQHHVQRVVAVRVQAGLEELSHVEGQEGQR